MNLISCFPSHPVYSFNVTIPDDDEASGANRVAEYAEKKGYLDATAE